METKRFTLFLVVLALFLSGCYFRHPVAESEIGLLLGDGVRVTDVKGAGRYTDLGSWYATIQNVDVSAKTLTWEDPDLVTNDKQPIGLNLAVTYSRDRSCIREMYSDYRSETLNDDSLANLVRTRIPRVAKALTTQYSLDEMLGVVEGGEFNRTIVQARLFELLTPELDEFCVLLRDVGINNISPSSTYLELLEEKSNAQVATEVSRERTLQLREQIRQEEAQTAIDLERARRENLVNEQLAKVYELSPQYYELERLRLQGDIIGDNDKIIFLHPGQDITYFLGQNNAAPSAVPVESNAVEEQRMEEPDVRETPQN